MLSSEWESCPNCPPPSEAVPSERPSPSLAPTSVMATMRTSKRRITSCTTGSARTCCSRAFVARRSADGVAMSCRTLRFCFLRMIALPGAVIALSLQSQPRPRCVALVESISHDQMASTHMITALIPLLLGSRQNGNSCRFHCCGRTTTRRLGSRRTRKFVSCATLTGAVE